MVIGREAPSKRWLLRMCRLRNKGGWDDNAGGEEDTVAK